MTLPLGEGGGVKAELLKHISHHWIKILPRLVQCHHLHQPPPPPPLTPPRLLLTSSLAGDNSSLFRGTQCVGAKQKVHLHPSGLHHELQADRSAGGRSRGRRRRRKERRLGRKWRRWRPGSRLRFMKCKWNFMQACGGGGGGGSLLLSAICLPSPVVEGPLARHSLSFNHQGSRSWLSLKTPCTSVSMFTFGCTKSDLTVEMCSASRQVPNGRTYISAVAGPLATLTGRVGKQRLKRFQALTNNTFIYVHQYQSMRAQRCRK